MPRKTRDNHGILKTQRPVHHHLQLWLAPRLSRFKALDSGGKRPDTSRTSVRQWTQDEESILLLPDPLEKSVDSRHSQRLGGHRAEAEVELEAVGHLQRETEHRSSFEHSAVCCRITAHHNIFSNQLTVDELKQLLYNKVKKLIKVVYTNCKRNVKTENLN